MRGCPAKIVAIGLVLLQASAAFPQEDVTASRRNALVTAIERVAPAVVTINVVEIQRRRVADPFFDEFWGLFGSQIQRPRVRERAVESIGSGFLFDTRGHIVTNFHVIQGADLISSVSLPDGRNLEVELVGFDERSDLAVLRAKGNDLPHVNLGDSASLLIGEWVIAIGNPFGTMMRDPQPSVSVGVISANHRKVSREVGQGERLYQDLIQTDAAINPGNSGGPLVNALGEVVGVNTMIFSSSGGSQGLGFAIPVNRVRRVVQEIIDYGRRRDPWLGFRGEAVHTLTPYSLQQLGVTASQGVLITELLKSAPAYDAGLRLGDVVVEMNGEPVSHPIDIDYLTWGLFVGDSATLQVDRRGSRQSVQFTIAELAKR